MGQIMQSAQKSVRHTLSICEGKTILMFSGASAEILN